METKVLKTDDVLAQLRGLKTQLRAELQARFGRPVDVVRYRSGVNPRLKAHIDREGRYV